MVHKERNWDEKPIAWEVTADTEKPPLVVATGRSEMRDWRIHEFAADGLDQVAWSGER